MITLTNGLKIILKEIHTAPLISQWLWYQVGSRNEKPGLTGISHWVEHMQFKSTPQYPASYLDRAIAREGGYWNASTYLDWTVYYETLPADKIDLALALEADRMENGQYLLQDVEAERTVILSERQGNENEPYFRLSEAVQSAAFQAHAYDHQVIGREADLLAITRDELYNHYRGYYAPNNAVLALAGDFDSQEMLKKLQRLYEPIAARPLPQAHIQAEPEQSAERQVVVEGPGETMYLEICYRAPAAASPDFFSLSVLDSLLAGAASPITFGGALSNKTSRLYQALVETEQAIHVGGGFQATIDPFLNSFSCIIHPQASPEKVLETFDAEINRIQNDPPEKQDVERAVKQARALFAYGSEGIANQACWLGLTEIINTSSGRSGQDWFENYLQRLAEVTPAEVQRVAQVYLKAEQRVVGIYQPMNGQAGEHPAADGQEE